MRMTRRSSFIVLNFIMSYLEVKRRVILSFFPLRRRQYCSSHVENDTLPLVSYR